MPNVTAFSQLVNALHPGATGRDLVSLLDGKAERTRVLHWAAGRRGTPQWAIDLLRAKLKRKHEHERAIANSLSAGPGKQAGTLNLLRYRARRA